MSLFGKTNEPVFLKETSSAHRQLEQLQTIDRSLLSENLINQLDREIKLVSLGLQGEKLIEFELRNSHMPMYVLHDLYLEHGGLSAQIDFLVVTRGRVFVIECKNLYGNIEINAKGDFIRTVYFGNRYQKDGLYSPITQNRRHLDLIMQIRRQEKGIIAKAIFEKYFFSNYRSVIVLANPKTVLNDKYAKKEIKSQVIRADALISHIRQVNSGEEYNNDKEIKSLAQFFLDAHIEREIDYTEKYRSQYQSNQQQIKNDTSLQKNTVVVTDSAPHCPKCGSKMVLRTAKRGTVGKQFWGCILFPKCRYTMAYSSNTA